MSDLLESIFFGLQGLLLEIDLLFLFVLLLLFGLLLVLLGLDIFGEFGLGILDLHGEDLLDGVSVDVAQLVLDEVERVLVDDEVLQGHGALLSHLHVDLLLLGAPDPVRELPVVGHRRRQHHHLDVLRQLHYHLLPH